jgi:hypothetical protein
MSEFKKKYVRRTIGEFLQSPPENGKEMQPGEKPRYYIKVTDDKYSGFIKKGSIIELEDPKVSIDRMIASDKVDEKRKEELRQQREKIPKFVIKKLILKIPENEFKEPKK